jgi:transcriptional regulator with XRE-family HTH domain
MEPTKKRAVETYWEIVEGGQEPDLAKLVREFPDEALALVEADLRRAHQTAGRAREKFWRARIRALEGLDLDKSLGTLLEERRRSLRLSRQALASNLGLAGVHVVSQTIEKLETGALPAHSVASEQWPAFASVLQLDGWLLFTTIEQAVKQAPKDRGQFARMDRLATEEERESFLLADELESPVEQEEYLRRVRTALGLPPP